MNRKIALVVGIGVALLLGGVARADIDHAKKIFYQGELQYRFEHWDQALTLFEAAYAEAQLPGFMFNIARAYVRLKKPKEASLAFGNYVGMIPESEKVKAEADWRTGLREIAKALAVDGKWKGACEVYDDYLQRWPNAEDRTKMEADRDVARQRARESEAVKAPEVLAPKGLLPDQNTPPPPTEKPAWKKWPMWVGIAAGIVVVGVAVGVGVGVGAKGDPSLSYINGR